MTNKNLPVRLMAPMGI
ncbi:hypothetical protein Nmel_009880 [Mimus melanotis]